MTIGSPSRAWCATVIAPECMLCVSIPVGKVEIWRQSCHSEGEFTPAPTPEKPVEFRQAWKLHLQRKKPSEKGEQLQV